MLKITASNKPITVKNLVMAFYALPGIGRTTLSFTANKPLLLDFDNGAYRAGNRKHTVEIAAWSDVAQMSKDDLDPYETIIVDTVGRCLDFMTSAIIEESPKNARGSGDLTLQGYGVLKGKFIHWLNLMRTYGKDVLLLAHMDEKMEGDIVKERFDIVGGSKNEIYKSADAIGKIYMAGKLRKLDFSPREGSLGKNPAQLPVLDIPDYQKNPLFLAGVIQQTKDYINKLSEEQKAEADAIEGWRKIFGACKTAADFNSLLPRLKTATHVVKMLAMTEATAKGFKFNREADEFYAPAVAVEAPTTLFEQEMESESVPEQKLAVAPPKLAAVDPVDDGLMRVVCHVSDVEKRRKAKGGDYWLLTCDVEGAQDSLSVQVWDAKMFDAVQALLGKDATLGCKRKETGDKVYYSLERIY